MEDPAAPDTHMADGLRCFFTLAQSRRFPPRDVPPFGGLHRGQLPVGGADNSGPVLRVPHPPDPVRRRSFCSLQWTVYSFHIKNSRSSRTVSFSERKDLYFAPSMITPSGYRRLHGHPACGPWRSSSVGSSAAACCPRIWPVRWYGQSSVPETENPSAGAGGWRC